MNEIMTRPRSFIVGYGAFQFNGSHSCQFVATSVYQATQPRHLGVQLYHEHTNKHTNKREGDSFKWQMGNLDLILSAD